MARKRKPKRDEVLIQALEGISLHFKLIRRSIGKMEQRTKQITMSPEERNHLLSEIGKVES